MILRHSRPRVARYVVLLAVLSLLTSKIFLVFRTTESMDKIGLLRLIDSMGTIIVTKPCRPWHIMHSITMTLLLTTSGREALH